LYAKKEGVTNVTVDGHVWGIVSGGGERGRKKARKTAGTTI